MTDFSQQKKNVSWVRWTCDPVMVARDFQAGVETTGCCSFHGKQNEQLRNN